MPCDQPFLLLLVQSVQHHRRLLHGKISLSTLASAMTLVMISKTIFINPVNCFVRNKCTVLFPNKNGLRLVHLFSNDKKVRYNTSLSLSSWMDKNERFASTSSRGNNKLDFSRRKEKGSRRDSDITRTKPDLPSGVIISGEISSEQRSPSFREDFRGTRVFVQNIPLHASWQDVSPYRRLSSWCNYRCFLSASDLSRNF